MNAQTFSYRMIAQGLCLVKAGSALRFLFRNRTSLPPGEPQAKNAFSVEKACRKARTRKHRDADSREKHNDTRLRGQTL